MNDQKIKASREQAETDKSEMTRISDEELEKVSGGAGFWFWDNETKQPKGKSKGKGK